MYDASTHEVPSLSRSIDLSIYLSINQSIYLSIYLSIDRSIYRPGPTGLLHGARRGHRVAGELPKSI
jgi:hypothetical protein